MARPAHIQDDDILRVTREIFLERGMRTTTASIAERAGVSEGILFKRFGSKAALLSAAAESAFVDVIAIPSTFPANVMTRPALARLAARMVGMMRQIIPMVHMCARVSATDEPPPGLRGPDPVPLRIIDAFTRLFARQMDLRAIRRGDPAIVARMFIGGLWHFTFLDTVLDPEARTLSEGAFIDGMTDTLWRGLAPARAHRGRASASGATGPRSAPRRLAP